MKKLLIITALTAVLGCDQISSSHLSKYTGQAYNHAASATPGVLNTAITPSEKSQINISFDFQIGKDFSSGPQYQNLFQTADFNTGIRLELAKENHWAILVGDKTGKSKGFDLGVLPTNGEWHKFKIEISNGEIVALLDNKTIITGQLEPKTFQVDHVLIGQGFSSERAFNGEIRDFLIEM